METNTFMMPIGGKSILRSTGEEVEIVDSQFKERGARSDEDWVTYIDSNGKEHIKEHLNLQLDFKPVVNDTWNSMFDWVKNNKMPTTRNCRMFEVAKELVKAGKDVSYAVDLATKLVDEVGIETVYCMKEDKVTNSNMPYRNLTSKEYINKLKSGDI